MAGQNILFGKTLTPSLLKGTLENKSLSGQPLTVNFEGGGKALLDPQNPLAAVWAAMIDFLQQENRPVYVETGLANIITRAAMPEAAVVLEINTSRDPETAEVAFKTFAALHSLRRDHPLFNEMLALLQTSMQENIPVLVTATIEFEVIDVRELPASMAEKFNLRAAPQISETEIPVTMISMEKAEELFEMMAGKTCVPGASAKKCIPFKYPRDGCWIRAHLMCFLLFAEGEIPKKVWSTGSLDADTPNDPKCTVHWIFHVAPVLQVEQPDGKITEMAFDPSMCSGPVPVEKWRSLQTDPKSTLRFTKWQQYGRFGGIADERTADKDMQKYRSALEEQCVDKGAPPYKQCLVPGTKIS